MNVERAGWWASLIGHWSWDPPRWYVALATALHRYVAWARANRVQAAAWGAALLALGGALLAGAWWWAARPKPQYVAVTIEAPGVRDWRDAESRPPPARFVFAEPAAPLALIGKDVPQGIALSPALPGTWRWVDETTLEFQPSTDWPVGQRYVATLQTPAVLRENLRLESTMLAFSSAPFTARIVKAEFYQDPIDARLKKIVATLAFSHPADPKSVEDRIGLRWAKGAVARGGLFGTGAATLAHRLSFDDRRLEAYVHSDPLEMRDEPAELLLQLEPGAKAAAGGPGATERGAVTVRVPGRFSLAVQTAELAMVPDERLEIDQILNLELSEGVAPAEIGGRLKAWLLPLHHPDATEEQRRRPFEWNTPALVAEEVLAASTPLPLEALAVAADYPNLHGFRYRADPGRYVYVKLERGVKSFGGFELGKRFDATLRVPELPQEVKILHSGAILSLRGERRLSLYSRDVPAIRYEIARVLPDRLFLLATQASGRFASPAWKGWSLSFDDLAEREEAVLRVEAAPAGRVQYHGFDLTPYLVRGGAARTGVFAVRVQGWDPQRRLPLGDPDDRLILVTDLGMVVKRAVDGTQDVFVQSLAGGEPVGGAVVQVLGRNGVALTTRTTDETGRAQLPSLDDFRREREPAMYLVRLGDDASFLPIDRSDRGLDYSRFDVGGVSNAVEAGELSAYLFSDRGIYRPGETMRIGAIVKAASWERSLAGVPLEVVVTDPRGATVKRERLRLSAAGFEELAHPTGEASPTGTYNVSLYIVRDGEAGARIGSTAVNVQEFLPDRLKLSVGLSEEREAGWVTPDSLAAKATLRTLFDTPAAERRIAARIRLTPSVPSFGAWREFRFSDPLKAKRSFEDSLGEVVTDAQGLATLPLELQRFDSGTYLLSLVVQAFEREGGRAVTQARSVLVSSMPYLVGVKADGDLGFVSMGAERNVELVAVDRRLAATEPPGLKVALVERRWLSVLERQPDGTLRYESRLKEIPVSEEPLALPNGRAQRRLPTGTPGEFALLVRDASGRELNRVEYSVAGAANVARRLDRNAELELKLSGRDFAPGQEIEISIRAPFAGAGLITIERDRVHAYRWFRADTTSSVQRIRLPEDFEGNGYVNVTFLRDANSSEIFTSPLSYGVVPFSANLDRRKLGVELRAPERVRPGETLELRYRADRAARIVVFGVDEGILQVAGYRDPDPLQFFFEKRALEVDTKQILDLLLPEFRKLMQSAPGGDAAGNDARFLNPFRRKRDPAVAFWSGVLPVDSKERVFRYAVPDAFNGAMRLLAVAVAPDAVGVSAAETVVRGDFVILPNLPTAVAPGDEFEVTASITNNVEGSGAAAELLSSLGVEGGLEIVGARETKLSVAERREGLVRYRLRATSKLGSATLTFQTRLGARTAKLSSTLSVRPATPQYALVSLGSFEGRSQDLPVTRDLIPEFRRQEATLSRHPLALAGGLEAYLDEYPYGCTEQMVSQAMPAVVLAGRPEFGLSNVARSPERFQRLLLQLRARQLDGGGFAYWPSEGEARPFPSAYTLQFLIEARERGQPVPRDMLERGAQWLADYAAGGDGSLGEERARALAIYLLTRLERVASNYANAQVERLDARFGKAWRSDLTAAYLAAAYQTMKQARLADQLISGVRFPDAREAWRTSWEDDGSGLLYTELMHSAQLLHLLARHFPQRLAAAREPALSAVVAAAGRERNTLSAAYTVLALDAWARATEVGAPAGGLRILEVLRDGKARELAAGSGLVRRAQFGPDAAKLRLEAEDSGPLFWSLTQSGFDRAPPATAASRNLEIVRELLDVAGRPVTTAMQGDELQVRLRVRGTAKDRVFWDGVIVDVLPGGFEPVLDEGVEAGGGNENWVPDFVDRREDRVLAFGAIGPRVQTFVYRVRATTVGRFTMPPAYAESMYDPSSQARSAPATIEVKAR